MSLPNQIIPKFDQDDDKIDKETDQLNLLEKCLI